ncbi:hypothetical protein CXB51_019605 [Gossypium anomalum]|uniref:RNase H type-1 domain-containing protein n=1 Tax=Gossypium anomalum TaxID=47600 RepID=A0A8J6CZZ0_9ROSI|nr:hypothetical protein CXB51_019605 [Gossypium anomalum]
MEKKILREVKASRSGPQEYERCSGQKVNYSKSTIFFSTNTQERDISLVTRVLGVRCSIDPERYLGLPILVGRRKKVSFQILKDRMQQRIDNWSVKHPSQGVKKVFIKAVLQSIPTYSMSCFLLPKSLCTELERLIAKFWWQKSRDKKGTHWCAWKDLFSFKEEGGIRFRQFDKFNTALLAKQGWRLITYPNSLLARRSIWSARGVLEKRLYWKIGKGDRISIWVDRWISGYEENTLQHQRGNADIVLVSDLIEGESRSWKTNLIFNTFDAGIAKNILLIPLARSVYDDFQVWGGEPTELQRLISDTGRVFTHEDRQERVVISFDGAFDQQLSRSASGLLVRDMRGDILASKSVIHENVALPFVAEARAREQAVRLGILLGIYECDINGDSRTVIKNAKIQTEITQLSEL